MSSEHIMANVYEAQRLAKELRRAIAAARWEIADDTARLRRVLAVRECDADDDALGWNEEAEDRLSDAMGWLGHVCESLDDIRDEAH